LLKTENVINVTNS